MWCTDTCLKASNGACEDGGPGSLFELYGQPIDCLPGTDCTDCGFRYELPPSPPPPSPPPSPPPPSPPPMSCSNTCPYANNGACQDAGPDSLYALYGATPLCLLGTDCDDCGP